MTAKIRVVKFLALTVCVVCAVAVAGLIFARFEIGIACIFKKFFGFECAGCGMTRATVLMLSGKLRQAYSYNAIFWIYWIELVAIYISSGVHYIKTGSICLKSASIIIDILVLFIVLIYGIIRMI